MRPTKQQIIKINNENLVSEQKAMNMCDPFWENVPKCADKIFPNLPIKT